MADITPSASVSDIRRSVLRHKKKAALVFALIVTASAALALLLPKTYRSEGKLLVRLGKENAMLDRTATMSQEAVVTVPSSRVEELNSVVEIIGSRAMAEKVVDALGPEFILAAGAGDVGNDADPPPGWIERARTEFRGVVRTAKSWLRRAHTDGLTDRDRAIVDLLDRYTVSSTRKTNVIEIACNGPSPRWAQNVVAKLIDSYLVEHIRLNRPEGSLEFFTEQTSRSRQELARAEEALRDLKTAAGVASAVEQRQALVLRVARLQDDLLQAETARAASESKVQTLQKQLAGLPAERTESKIEGFSNEGTDNIRAQLYSFLAQREEAAAKYTPEHPFMQALEQKIRASQDIARSEPPTRTHITTSVNKLHEETHIALLQEEPVLASLQAKAGALRDQLAVIRGELKAFNENQMQIVKLDRDIELKQSAFCKYAANLEQARIDQALATQCMSNISVAQPATFDPVPAAPKAAMILAMGLLSGLLGGIGAVLLGDWRDHTLRTPEDLQRRLGIPVLGSIPRLPERQVGLHAR